MHAHSNPNDILHNKFLALKNADIAIASMANVMPIRMLTETDKNR